MLAAQPNTQPVIIHQHVYTEKDLCIFKNRSVGWRSLKKLIQICKLADDTPVYREAVHKYNRNNCIWVEYSLRGLGEGMELTPEVSCIAYQLARLKGCRQLKHYGFKHTQDCYYFYTSSYGFRVKLKRLLFFIPYFVWEKSPCPGERDGLLKPFKPANRTKSLFKEFRKLQKKQQH